MFRSDGSEPKIQNTRKYKKYKKLFSGVMGVSQKNKNTKNKKNIIFRSDGSEPTSPTRSPRSSVMGNGRKYVSSNYSHWYFTFKRHMMNYKGTKYSKNDLSSFYPLQNIT